MTRGDDVDVFVTFRRPPMTTHRQPVGLPSTDDRSAYEDESARRIGRRHAVAFGFARHALGVLLASAGLEPGDEVLLSPLTCKVVPLSLLWMGLKPVYVDISWDTLNMDPSCLRAAIRAPAKALVFQHTYGSDLGLNAVAQMASEHGLFVAEDRAHCMPMSDAGASPGRAGHAAVFSNNLLKPLPAGSGGLVATDDDALATRVREARDRLPLRTWWQAHLLRWHDWAHRRVVGPRTYWPLLTAYQRIGASHRERPIAVEIAGQVANLACRPSAFQFKEGLRWLEIVEEVAHHRRLCCADYAEGLGRGGSSFSVPHMTSGTPLLYFPVLTKGKRTVLEAATRRLLQVVAWPGSTPIYPVERMAALRAYGYEPGSCPVAERVATQLLGLPTELSITAVHRRRIVDLITESTPV